MPAAVYLVLSSEQDEALRSLSRRTTLDAQTRARLEAVRLSNKGWQAQQVAAHLGVNIETVRRAYQRFTHEGEAGLLPKARPRQEPTISGKVRQYLESVLSANAASQAPRTLTAPDLALALEERFGRPFHRETVRVAVRRLGYRYKRTRHAPAGTPDEAAYRETVEKLETFKNGG